MADASSFSKNLHTSGHFVVLSQEIEKKLLPVLGWFLCLSGSIQAADEFFVAGLI